MSAEAVIVAYRRECPDFSDRFPELDSRESPRSGYTSEKAANRGDLSIYVEPFHELEAC